jgi:hypothetical protein
MLLLLLQLLSPDGMRGGVVAVCIAMPAITSSCCMGLLGGWLLTLWCSANSLSSCMLSWRLPHPYCMQHTAALPK